MVNINGEHYSRLLRPSDRYSKERKNNGQRERENGKVREEGGGKNEWTRDLGDLEIDLIVERLARARGNYSHKGGRKKGRKRSALGQSSLPWTDRALPLCTRILIFKRVTFHARCARSSADFFFIFFINLLRLTRHSTFPDTPALFSPVFFPLVFFLSSNIPSIS